MKLESNFYLKISIAVAMVGGTIAQSYATDLSKTLRVGNHGEATTLNPQYFSTAEEGRIVCALFEGLVSDDPTSSDGIAPGVAERWEISQDKRSYTFYLRTNAKWSNGERLGAKDFYNSFRKLLAPKNTAIYSSLLYTIENAEAYAKGEITDFAKVGVEILNADTLRIRLATATPYFLKILKHPVAFPVHPSMLENDDAVDLQNLISNGPFKLKNWRMHVSVDVIKNEHYWDAAGLAFDSIQFIPLTDPQTELRYFQDRKLDVTFGLPPESLATFKNDARRRQDPLAATTLLYINSEKAPYNDWRVRKALSLTLDRNLIVNKIFFKSGRAAMGLSPGGLGDFQATAPIEVSPENINEAQRLLARAGFAGGHGFPLVTLSYASSGDYDNMAVEIQSMWKEALGIQVILQKRETNVHNSAVFSDHDYEIAVANFYADYPDPLNFLGSLTAKNLDNPTGWENADYDKLIARVKSGQSPDRLADFTEAERILFQQAPVIPIFWKNMNYMIDPRVQGWASKSMPFFRNFKGISLQAPPTEKKNSVIDGILDWFRK